MNTTNTAADIETHNAVLAHDLRAAGFRAVECNGWAVVSLGNVPVSQSSVVRALEAAGIEPEMYEVRPGAPGRVLVRAEA